MATTYNKVVVKSLAEHWDEAACAEIVSPCMLVFKDANKKFAKLNTAGMPCGVVTENDLFGKTIDTAYASGDQVRVKLPLIGESIVVFGPAEGTALAVGDYVKPAVDGITSKIIATAAVDAVDYDAGPPIVHASPAIPAYTAEEQVAMATGPVYRVETVLATDTVDRRVLVTVVK
jgi:hypothetical protein